MNDKNISTGATASTLDQWLEKIKSADDAVRGPAWQQAPEYGAQAVKPLAEIMASSSEMEIARAAQRALWLIVRRAGRPGAGSEQAAVVSELLPWLSGQPESSRREILWMLSEIGGGQSVRPMARWLSDEATREDARLALQRIPRADALAALTAALDQAPDSFKPNLAASLRARGKEVPGIPDGKLVPTKRTGVKAILAEPGTRT